MELRLVQIRDTRAAPMLATVSKTSFRRHKKNGRSDSDESVSGGSSPNVIPKDEGVCVDVCVCVCMRVGVTLSYLSSLSG